jgi:hypothetical protein
MGWDLVYSAYQIPIGSVSNGIPNVYREPIELDMGPELLAGFEVLAGENFKSLFDRSKPIQLGWNFVGSAY